MFKKLNWELISALGLCVAIWVAFGIRMYKHYHG